MFFFANFSMSNDSAPGRLAANSTVPATQAELNGDFSDLLQLPTGAGASTPAGHSQYLIYDPLTTRPDPARPGRVIRDPFPGNIIPKNRFMNADGTYKNPAFALYRAMVPAPNQNFLAPNQQPTNNYYRAAEPDQPHNVQTSVRVDYNHSDNSRFFVRGNGNKFLESSLSDWTYASPDPKFQGLHDVARARYSWSGTGTWTRVLKGSTVIDTQVSGNRAFPARYPQEHGQLPPTSVGLPSYLDDFCSARFECLLPQDNISGYQGMGGTVDGGIAVTTYQAQSNLTSTRGSHTLRGGVDVQMAQRTTRDGAGNMGTFSYDNQYTRATDETNSTVYPSQNLGLSLAAFMLGMPSSTSIADNQGFDVRNNYFGTFAQDTWRVGHNLTLNIGLRFEWENGIKEQKNRALLWFDPNATNSITAAAQAAYAANPLPELPASQFKVQGGSIYEGTPGYSDRTWKPEALWMPRFSFGYKLGDKNVIKGGYGMYYDTLNARDWTPNQDGYNVTTTNQLSNDFGQTFALGNPRAGVLPLADPFPVRAATGSRYEIVPGNALGADDLLGRGFTAENPNRVHSRVQRWRMGWQRELTGRTALEIAYDGSYGDRQGIPIRQDYLPEQYWSGAKVRDNSANDFLTANVTNPFNIANFASFQTSNPLLYQRLQGSTVFTSTTIQRNRLLRAFPQQSAGNNGLRYNDQPLGIIKTHSLEVTLSHRYGKGLTANAGLTINRVTENRTVEEYDRAPTLWETNNNGRPYRVTAAAVYDLPFGPGKAFLNKGVLGSIAGGWTLSGTYEYQPGALLNWNNLFFNGNLSNIAKKNPEIALQPDGTFDPTKTWFNIDAGFEKITANAPAGFQKRTFPFRVDGVRGFDLSYLNASVARTFNLGGRRSFQFRVDIQNLPNRQHYGNPTMDPTSTNFGQVRAVNNNVMRFFTFNSTLRF